ncbi:transglutaminaseTgpA domain-containing protein [Psychromonas aquimarina]|uniref:transglutaminase family protein n=1 Tax=Psychromonas aquimarina TaxID=444919 RepID=UPI0004190DA3|nr:DUF3488 and transglutaminase-like domain-containing protein [Psychromonas aquimarina]
MKEFLTRQSLVLINLSYIAIAASLFNNINPLLLIFGLLCAAWRIVLFYGRVSILPKLLLNSAALLSTFLIIVLVYKQGLFSVMLHLILLGFSLKFLELKSERDVHYFVNTGFILVALFFIFNSSIVTSLLGGGLILLLLAVLLSIHAPHCLFAEQSKLLFKSAAVSLPLAVVLFIVIPRLPSLWKVPLQKQAATGLSDSVSPGEIAQLSRSSELAFRASFTGAPVEESERYWRVMILDAFDGRTWSQSAVKKEEEKTVLNGESSLYGLSGKLNSYDLILEPHYKTWIPALDFSQVSFSAVNLSDYSLRSRQPVFKRKDFTADLYQSVNSISLSAERRFQLTKLPEQGNEKTRLWLAAQLKRGLSKDKVLKLLLDGFSAQAFRYTLQPPVLGAEQIDDFLFSTQAGFCVHYAGAYVYAARSLGIPARMVTGYLGGEWQADLNFLTVRQYDAHAWAEIWQDGQWQRVDPTAYVAPERVELGLEGALSDSSEFLAGQYLSLQKWRHISFLNDLRLNLARLDYLWAVWVINYDNKKQLELLTSWFAQYAWLNMLYGILVMMLCAFLFVVLITFKPWQKKKREVEDRLYLQLQAYYAKLGVIRGKGQTVSDYAENIRLSINRPTPLFEKFAVNYNRLKYQAGLSAGQRTKLIKELQALSRQIRAGKN